MLHSCVIQVHVNHADGYLVGRLRTFACLVCH